MDDFKHSSLQWLSVSALTEKWVHKGCLNQIMCVGKAYVFSIREIKAIKLPEEWTYLFPWSLSSDFIKHLIF